MQKLKANQNVIIFYEKGLQPIQIHFRNKKFRRNFKQYKDELKSRKDEVQWKGIPDELKSMNNYFLLICILKRKIWEFIAWNLVSFDSYRCEVDKTGFNKYSINKDQLFDALSKFFEVDTTKQALYFNDAAAKDYLEKMLQD